MEVDAARVIAILKAKIADLELQNAVLEASGQQLAALVAAQAEDEGEEQ